MASVCISNCIEDSHVPVRPTYTNLYKWPESDAEFVRSVSSNGHRAAGARRHPTVVDSISCRQMFLRSYTFSRKESVPEKTKKCLEKVKLRIASGNKSNKAKSTTIDEKKRPGRGACMKAKEGSCNALFSFFRRLLFCTAKVDVVDDIWFHVFGKLYLIHTLDFIFIVHKLLVCPIDTLIWENCINLN